MQNQNLLTINMNRITPRWHMALPRRTTPDHQDPESSLRLVPVRSNDGDIVLMGICSVCRAIFQVMYNTRGKGRGNETLKRSGKWLGTVHVRGELHRQKKLRCVRELNRSECQALNWLRPLSQPTARRRIEIQQPPYVCGNRQLKWIQQGPVDFFVRGQPGIRLTDALDPHFSDLDRRHDMMFQYAGAGSSVSCRIHVRRSCGKFTLIP
jgi:hypothetical protein